MDANVKRIWVAALRSGKYDQGKGRLRSENGGYCCLGVLCDLYGNDLWRFEDYVGDDEEEDNESDWLMRDWQYAPNKGEEKSTVLPPLVMEWAGLPHQNPRIEHSYNTLAEANDKGASFDAIADIIEEQF